MTLAPEQPDTTTTTTRAAADDALAAALRDPEVRAALAVIAANAPALAVLVSASDALLARSRDIVDNVNGRVLLLRETADGRQADLAPYRELLHAFGESAPVIESFLTSPVLQPQVVDVIGRVGGAATEADRLTRGRRSSVGGALALMRQLKDPQIQSTLAFFVEFARAFGRSQAAGKA